MVAALCFHTAGPWFSSKFGQGALNFHQTAYHVFLATKERRFRIRQTLDQEMEFRPAGHDHSLLVGKFRFFFLIVGAIVICVQF